MELPKMRKCLPLQKSQPDAISSKMYLTIQRLTLQRPSLRYPDYLRKLRHNLKPDSWTQQEKEKPSKKQKAKKKVKRDVEDQYGEETMSRYSFHDHVGLHISRHEIEQKLLEEEQEMEETSLGRHTSLDESMTYEFESYYAADYYTSPESTLLYETIYQDLSDGEESEIGVGTSSKDHIPKSLSAVMKNTSWNPELKLLRILQATEEEDEESHLSRARSEASLEA